VDHHSGGFIYDCEVVIFINDIQEDVFRHCAQRRPFDFADNFNLFASAQQQGSLGAFSVDENLFLRYELLDSRTAGAEELRDEEVVEAPTGVVLANHKSS
jgi:hypothetical protein